MSDKTITKVTAARYQRIVVNLRKQAAYKLRCLPQDVSVTDLCRYLIDRHRDLSASTWRSYRAAIYHVYGYGMDKDKIKILAQIPGGGKKAHLPAYGARQKMKSFPDVMLNSVLNYLSSRQTKMGNALWLWLTVGIETGLRPFEWFDASLIDIDGRPFLRVKNAKNTNGRANGDYRHLNLEDMPPSDRQFIQAQLQVVQAIKLSVQNDPEQGQKKFNSYYSSCRRRLNVVVRRLWPDRDKYPSLYSLRHQFIANAKAEGFSLEEIAAMCGQASAETSAIHYGRKQNGRQGVINVKPRQQEVATVKQGREFQHRNRSDNQGD